jgi:hypothetical protein
MTYFREALSAPALHFKRLRSAEPLLCNGEPIIRRTHSAIESEIVWEGRRYLLLLPFRQESIQRLEELESIALNRSRAPLLENRILHEELTMFDSLGHKHSFDIVLTELPSGVILKEAIACYRADDLREAICKMKERMDAIGFRHNNLKAENILICDSGTARPLRYWYAEWEIFSDNNIEHLLHFIDRNCAEGSSSLPMMAHDCEAEYIAKSTRYDGTTRLCRGHRYGFADCDGRQITPFIYSWASEFKEGRAVVAKGSKMGAIDENGRSVIPIIYKSVEFDIETGFLHATNGGYHYLIDYEGRIIRRTKVAECDNANTQEAEKRN